MSDDAPAGVVADAGPLIAYMDARDDEHRVARRGLELLIASRSRIVVPLPIVFEVFKWLAYERHREVARAALELLRRGAEIRYPEPLEMDHVTAILHTLPSWRGSMEDALLVVTCQRLRLPIWTINYRDLNAFRGLQFWNPA
jgi:predicted nucleic acid-binding protein